MASEPTSQRASRLNFGLYTADEIRSLSVKRITNPTLLDDLNHPTKGGLYDPALGATQPHENCETCHQPYINCPGHVGHIELVLPVYNPIFYDSLLQTLRGACFFCHHFKVGRTQVETFLCKMKLVNLGLVEEAENLEMALNEYEAEEEVTGKDRKASMQQMAIRAAKSYLEECVEKAGKSLTVTQEDLNKRTTTTNNITQQLVKQFLSSATKLNKCQNCDAPTRTYRKNGVGRIFLMPMSEKARNQVISKGMNPEGNDVFEGQVLKGEVEEFKEEKEKSKTKKEKGQPTETFLDDQAEESEDSVSEDDDEDEKKTISAEVVEKEKVLPAGGMRYLTPEEVRQYIRCLYDADRAVFETIYGRTTIGKDGKPHCTAFADMFFLEVMPVPPSRFRPANKIGDMIMEASQNTYLSNILKQNVLLLDMIQKSQPRAPAQPTKKGKKGDDMEEEMQVAVVEEPVPLDMRQVQNAWSTMQMSVNGLMDNTTLGAAAARMPAGIKQILEKKEGLFRMHMMGKRVNHSCRSVISPDPYIGTNEMGIPMVFATRLTFPEPVTPWNVHELRDAVANGPDIHPGATHVEHEDGRITALSALSPEARQALANQLLTPPEGGRTKFMLSKKVYRHIKTGDMVLANRQPTLHKPSIMAHHVHVLPGEKTLRMHYANCNTYNADFDGDEMNVHFPQSLQARAEAMLIANTNNQYIVPTSGKPLRGLIQDHVASGAVLTSRTTLMDAQRYQQLVYTALPDIAGRVRTLPPCIIKPKPMWSGKQVVSTIILNICIVGREDREALNLDSQSKIPASLWGENSEEATVIIRGGELLCGVLDKAQFGASSYGLVHACYELYGPDAAGNLLTALGRLFTAFLQTRGLTCGLDDLLLTPAGDENRAKLLEQDKTAGAEQVANYIDMPWAKDDVETLKDGLREIYKSDDKMKGLDATMKSRLNALTSDVINSCLPNAAAKPFPLNNLSLMIQSGAKGSSVNSSQISCLLGQQELEGRRVPIMVSGRSLPSFLPFDTSARGGGYVRGRFLTGIKPQEYFFHCMAGREGLIDTAVKTARSGYLQRCLIKHLEGLQVHYDLTVRDTDGSVVQFAYGEDSVDVTRTAFLEKFDFLYNNQTALLRKYNLEEASAKLNFQKASKLYRKNAKAVAKGEFTEPVLGVLRPDLFPGATSERFHFALDKFLKEAEAKGDDKDTQDAFRLIMWLKYRASLADPGEAVGLLAAQSVGEPSTQMTLNTFHFAGFGAMNVTLGIPRLREILMTASPHIKTPAMTIPLRRSAEHPNEIAKVLRHRFTRITLSDIISTVQVKEWLVASSHGGDRQRKYHVRLEMNQDAITSPEVAMQPRELLKAVEEQLLKMVERSVAQHLKQGHFSVVIKKQTDNDDEEEKSEWDNDVQLAASKKKKSSEEGDDDDDDENEDGDATDQKMKKNKKEASTYDEEGDEEEEEEEDDDETGEGVKDDKEIKEDDFVVEKLEEGLKDKRVDNVLSMFHYVCSYDYDVNGEWVEFTLSVPSHSRKLLLVSLIEGLTGKVVVRSSPGITRCIIAEPDAKGKDPVTLQTEGSNLREVWKYADVVDVEKLYTNDIYAILVSYGVEAARAAIMREVAGVFKVYGISVDNRHLSLIADYMTFEGGYKPFNRIGIDSNTSPLAKMTFETTMKFMKQAVMCGDFDTLQNPSARIVLGRVVDAGTGCMELMQPISAM